MAGALTASIVPWSPLPKAVLVGVIAAIVAALSGFVMGPRSAS